VVPPNTRAQYKEPQPQNQNAPTFADRLVFLVFPVIVIS
jgi:hypothetical protein